MSIKIENIVAPSGEQWEAAIRGLRNPMNSWEKTDSVNFSDPLTGERQFVLGKADLELMRKLAKAGSDHRKYLRQLPVIMDVTAPVYFASEMDTYKVGTVRNSCSFMHRGCAKPFTIDDFSVNGERAKRVIEAVIGEMNVLRKEYLATKDDAVFLEIRSILPMGYDYRFTWSANYEVLWNVFQARKNHRLPEWRAFCETIVREIPFFAEIFEIK